MDNNDIPKTRIWSSKFCENFGQTLRNCNCNCRQKCDRPLSVQTLFLWAGRHATSLHHVFQENLDRNLGNKTPAWQDDMEIVTRGTIEDQYKEVVEILKIFQKKSYHLKNRSFRTKKQTGADSKLMREELRPESHALKQSKR